MRYLESALCLFVIGPISLGAALIIGILEILGIEI